MFLSRDAEMLVKRYKNGIGMATRRAWGERKGQVKTFAECFRKEYEWSPSDTGIKRKCDRINYVRLLFQMIYNYIVHRY